MLLRRIERVGNHRVGALRDPLVRARRALRQLPLVAEQVLEEVVAPLRRRRRPRDFEPARDRVRALARAVRALPAEALRFDARGLRLGADVRRGPRAVRLAERVAARDQRDRLFVVHRHAREGVTNVARRGDRIGIAVRAFRIHVDEAHLHGGERVLELAVARIAAVRAAAQFQPDLFRAPVDVLGLPRVRAAAREAEGLEAHRFERDVARQDQQVGPRDGAAVLPLDRPQQPARLVEVRVVGPAVERREALLPFARAAAAVGRAVRARAVPCHADEQAAVVAEIGRPPVLRRRHQRVEVALHRREVELLERLRVVEILAHRIGQRRVPMQDAQVQLIGPPVPVRRAVACGLMERALRFIRHAISPLFVYAPPARPGIGAGHRSGGDFAGKQTG